MMTDIAKALKKAHPGRRWATREAPYWVALVASFSIQKSMFHGLRDISGSACTGMPRQLKTTLVWNG